MKTKVIYMINFFLIILICIIVFIAHKLCIFLIEYESYWQSAIAAYITIIFVAFVIYFLIAGSVEWLQEVLSLFYRKSS